MCYREKRRRQLPSELRKDFAPWTLGGFIAVLLSGPLIWTSDPNMYLNNPAFQLFLMATIAPYNLCWPVGEQTMLLVSVGTGASADANANLVPGQMNLVYNASSIPSALMFAASNEQDFLCRVFGKTMCGAVLDSEVGDLIAPADPLPSGRIPGPVHPKLFTYMRYNADLSKSGLTDLKLPDIRPEEVQQMDSVEHIAELEEVGKAAARAVKAQHFAGFLREAAAVG